MNMDMMAYREYIDNEMMVTFAQMDKPSRIFDYLYLVRWDGATGVTAHLGSTRGGKMLGDGINWNEGPKRRPSKTADR